MANIPEARSLLQIEEARYGAAGSESLMLRFGAQMNFLNLRHVEVREMFINGVYNGIVPNIAVDGLVVFEYPVELVNVYAFNRVSGSGGLTVLDVKWKPQGSGTWTSIFSTAPQIASNASAYEACGVGQSATGFTAPVLSKTTFAAHDMLRLDLLSAQEGSPTGCGIILHYRPV